MPQSTHYRQGCVPYKPKTKMMDSHKASSLSNSPISTPTASHYSGSSPPLLCDSGPPSLRTHSLDSFSAAVSSAAEDVGLFKVENDADVVINVSNGHASNGQHQLQPNAQVLRDHSYEEAAALRTSRLSMMAAVAAASANSGVRETPSPSDALTLAQLSSLPTAGSAAAAAVLSSTTSPPPPQPPASSSTTPTFTNIQPRPLASAAVSSTAADSSTGPVMMTDATGRAHAVITQQNQLRNLASAGQLVAGEGGQLYLVLPGNNNGTGANADVASSQVTTNSSPASSGNGALSSNAATLQHHQPHHQQPHHQLQQQQPQALQPPPTQPQALHEQPQALPNVPGVRLQQLSSNVNRLLGGMQLASEPCSPSVTPPTPLPVAGLGPAISPRPAVQPRLEVSSAKEEKRRNNHNEVERRRRDRINQWISELARMLPPEFATGVPTALVTSDPANCPLSPQNGAHSLASPIATSSSSKGTVLKKVVDYVRQLKVWYENALQNVCLHEARANVLQQENEELRREVEKLRSALSHALDGVSAQHQNGSQPRDVPMEESEETLKNSH